MKKQVAIFSFLVLFLIPFSFFAFAQEEKQHYYYQNEYFGYSMNVPEEYSVTSSPFNDVIIISSDNPSQVNGVDNINVLVTRHDDKSFLEMTHLVKNDLENFGNEITDEMQIQLGNNDENDNNNDNDSNDKKAILIKSYTDIGVPIFFESVVAYHGNQAYFITLSYTDKKTQDTFYDILDSFEFADKNDFIAGWIKDVSAKWSEGETSDEEFANTIKYMIVIFSVSEDVTLDDVDGNDNDNGNSDDNGNSNSDEKSNNDKKIVVPDWLKKMALSWSHGEIDNHTWKELINYLYQKEIIIL